MRATLTPFALVVCALAIAAPFATAAIERTPFDTLRQDASALSHPQPFIAKIDASESAFLRGNTCASSNILGALSNQVAAGLIAPPEGDRTALQQLQADVQAALRAFPPGPARTCAPPPDGG